MTDRTDEKPASPRPPASRGRRHLRRAAWLVAVTAGLSALACHQNQENPPSTPGAPYTTSAGGMDTTGGTMGNAAGMEGTCCALGGMGAMGGATYQ